MSAVLDAAPRRDPLADLRRLGSLVLLFVVLFLLAVGAASADRPPAVQRVSAAEAVRSGSLIEILDHSIGGSRLVEVNGPGPNLLLAVAADGSQAALADQLGQVAGTLTLARRDGSQLRIALPGLLAAGFSPDGSHAAVVDGRGVLWAVDAGTGAATQVADGPFLGSPIVAADGSVLLLTVSSVEAPFRARAVRVDPSTGVATQLTRDDLDYAAFPLRGGSLAVISHESGGTAVRRIATGAFERITPLEPGAVNVVVAADGVRVAYEIVGRGIFLLDGHGSSPTRVGAGSHPCFSADASVLLVRRGSGTATLALDGSVLGITNGQAGLAGAVGCLP